MQFLLNKRLLMPFIVLLTAFNVLPVGLFSFYNLDILKLASLLILLLAVLRFKGYFNTDIKYVSLFVLSIVASTACMFTRGKYMDWTLFYCLNYLNFYLLLCSFKKMTDVTDYIKMIVFLSIIASLIHMLFFCYPDLLKGRLNEIRIGSVMNDAQKTRVFIPGMGFIAICFTYLLTKFIYYRSLTFIETCCVILFFVSIFIFASVRTYLLGVFVMLITMLISRKLSLKKIGYATATVIGFVFILSLVNPNVLQYLNERFNIFFQLKDFKFWDAVRLDIDYDNELTFGTVYFRILEAVYVIQNFSHGLLSILFGNLGTLYDFLGVEQETAPHVSIIGLYYLFGIIGLSTFLFFWGHFTRLIIKNLKKFKNTQHEFLSIALTILWFSLFVFSFFGGIYYSEMILSVVFVAAATIILKKQPAYEETKN